MITYLKDLFQTLKKIERHLSEIAETNSEIADNTRDVKASAEAHILFNKPQFNGEREEMEILRTRAETLHSALNDIASYTEHAKKDDKAYRNMVERRVWRVFNIDIQPKKV